MSLELHHIEDLIFTKHFLQRVLKQMQDVLYLLLPRIVPPRFSVILSRVVVIILLVVFTTVLQLHLSLSYPLFLIKLL